MTHPTLYDIAEFDNNVNTDLVHKITLSIYVVGLTVGLLLYFHVL